MNGSPGVRSRDTTQVSGRRFYPRFLTPFLPLNHPCSVNRSLEISREFGTPQYNMILQLLGVLNIKQSFHPVPLPKI